MARYPNRNILWLLTGFICLSLIGFFTNTFQPDTVIRVTIFLILVFAAVTSFFTFMLANLRLSILIAVSTVIWLFLRYIHLRQLIFPLLLVALVISVDQYLKKK